jgi:hypothetical protein
VDLLRETYFRDGALPEGVKSWKELFGRIYADMQVHITERGFINTLCRYGAKHLVHRYQIDWRSSVTWSPKKFGASHWTDNVIWFFGDGKVLPEDEKRIITAAFTNEYAKFVKGDTLDWKASSPLEARGLRSDGSLDVWQDVLWKEKNDIWNALQEASAMQTTESRRANL